MNIRKLTRHWLILTPFAVLLAALGYWNIIDDTPKSERADTEAQPTIDFYIHNSHTLQFNQAGELHYEFTAKQVDHLQETDISLLQLPDLKLFRGTEFPWLINSLRGEIGPDGKEIKLFDNVRVERHDEQARPFLLTTSELTYLPDTDHAHTTAPVQIDSAHGITTATGMHAFLKQGTVQLLSTVRGRYETQ